MASLRTLRTGGGLLSLMLIAALALPLAHAQEESLDDAASTPAVASAEAVSGAALEEDIQRELRDVENEINLLKEEVFRSKARLLLLEEKVIRGVVASAKAVLHHVIELGPAYVVEQVIYYFDGTPIWEQVDAQRGSTAEQRVKIFEGNIPAGNHSLTVSGLIRGSGLGLFSYLRDYEFKFQSTHSFVAEDGRTSAIDTVVFRVGGAAGDFTQLDVRFDMETIDGAPQTTISGEAAE